MDQQVMQEIERRASEVGVTPDTLVKALLAQAKLLGRLWMLGMVGRYLTALADWDEFILEQNNKEHSG